ncbi:tyrosine aminotransferase, partial [Caerostris extrusa]
MPIRISATLADPPQLQRQEPNTRRGWNVRASEFATGTVNPIRVIIEDMKLTPNPEKKMISLSIGDPTVAGHLKPCNEILDSVEKSHLEAREAVASYSVRPGAPIEAKDVVLTSGCSHALELFIGVLANPGQTILVPRPGFPLYKTLAKPEKSWEVDLGRPRAPNYVRHRGHSSQQPFQSLWLRVFPKASSIYFGGSSQKLCAHHCRWIMSNSYFQEKNFIQSHLFHYLFLVPGWRMGWILIHDRNDVFGSSVRNGLQALCQRIMGTNTIVQGALPAILGNTPQNFFNDVIMSVKINASIAFSVLSEIPGLTPIMPSGAMYMMVGVDVGTFSGFHNDTELVEKLVSEQSVMCLPGA